ncbi:TFIIB-type zinc ribbon-containing protein [candidate division WWE3 bacterium]|uniref:TFIIB-type zinc ribbon-containing protein n=1 Tax=candidate division WWE3 bacterium TaxID=2053526 RepID=A0A7X9HH39_UNCKA|nr:TFIIB-type zinc ribbon-containing protein [candidate division WWE3 bacterium]
MQRTCPACHEKLTTNDHFFCGNCGSVLESALVVNTGASKKIIDLDKIAFQKTKPKKKKITEVAKNVVEITNLQGIVILLAVLGFIGLPTYIFLSGLHTDLLQSISLAKKRPSVVTLPATPKIAQTSGSVKSLPLLSARLGNQTLIPFVPYNVDIIVESGDVYNAIKMLVIKDNYYRELHDVLVPVISEHFVFFAKSDPAGTLWAVVMPLKSDANMSEFSIPEKYSWLHLKKIDNFIILSNSAQLVENSIAASSGLEKNINMNPVYVQLRSKVSATGKMSFVAITGEGKNLLSKSLPPEIPQDLTEILMSHFISNSNYLVIRD